MKYIEKKECRINKRILIPKKISPIEQEKNNKQKVSEKFGFSSKSIKLKI